MTEAVLADHERVLGPDHAETVRTRYALALAYRRAERATEAVPVFEAAFRDHERTFGPYHPETLDVGNFLAAALDEAGRSAAARSLLRANLTNAARVLPGTR
jgi:hypothetical protein